MEGEDMIGYIKGVVEEIGSDYIILENNGIGFKLNVSVNAISKFGVGESIKIFSKMIVREDDISLCGFYSKEEMEMFNLLTSVSKIGTKSGLSILSFAEPEKLKSYIANSDIISLSKAPGVGKKTAERMVLELKDKIGKVSIVSSGEVEVTNGTSMGDEAIEALIALGYSHAESSEAVGFVAQLKMSTEDIVKKALEYLMKTSMKF